jgi:hypothetical protein
MVSSTEDPMIIPRALISWTTAACGVLIGGAVVAQLNSSRAYQRNDSPSDDAQTESPVASIRFWPQRSRLVALAMMQKYGEPDGYGINALMWHDVGKWKRMIVYRDGLLDERGLPTKDILQQTILYKVRNGKLGDLSRFDQRIEVDKYNGELSSRSENEALNFLTLNLAEEIVTGKRGVGEARAYARKTVEFSKSGKSSVYMEGFLFSVEYDRFRDREMVSPAIY